MAFQDNQEKEWLVSILTSVSTCSSRFPPWKHTSSFIRHSGGYRVCFMNMLWGQHCWNGALPQTRGNHTSVTILACVPALKASPFINSTSLESQQWQVESSQTLNLSNFPFCQISLTLAGESSLLLKLHEI